jgi:peptidoglycan/xylan/chitin deacetylase (PgdA/CDA1 family)
MSTVKNIVSWSRGRDPRWIARRGLAVAGHYGLSTRRAKRRVLECVELLARYDARPMFATPGRVLEAERDFFVALAERGVELAPHGYDHLDFRRLGTERARLEFERSCAAFEGVGVPFTGFRCPYLSFDETVAPALPSGQFVYGSNMAIRWQPRIELDAPTGAVARQLASFYQASPSERFTSRPRLADGIVEIPATLPDDFELTIARGSGAEGVAAAWTDVLDQVAERGELFAPLFHPEAYDHCATAFEQALDRARRSDGAMWTPTLAEIGAWWTARAQAVVTIADDPGGLRVEIDADPRATVLVRGCGAAPTRAWGEGWDALTGTAFVLPGPTRPVVGLAAGVPESAAAILREEGFVVEPASERSAVVLDEAAGVDFGDEVALLGHVEASAGPLVRVWRWPDGARSVVTVAGDLDALSITDYLARFRAR